MNIELLKFLRTPAIVHQKKHVAEKLAILPNMWGLEVEENYWRLNDAKNERAANEYLAKVTDQLRGLLDIAADDDAIKTLADEVSFAVRERAGWRHLEFAEYAKRLCAGYGVRFPDYDENEGIVLRLSCNVWWLRKLRQAHAKAREIAAIDAGLVHRKSNVYVSDDTLERRSHQLKRNAFLMQGVTLESASVQRMKLADVAAAGMGNADNRRAELMTRITGFEELANKYGHKAVFVTVTCPSKMHAITKDGKVNPKYDGTKPDEAQKYLVHCWAKCRAKLAKQGINFYGLRVVEPHHDGTPHWHMIFFFKEKDKSALTGEIRFSFLREDWHEAGASENRVKFVHIKPSKGTAAGYIVKYVCKNLGGIKDEKSDETDKTSESLAGRVEAWASTWGIRQFQQIGGHSVTVWRELRRVSNSVALEAGRAIFAGWQAAQRQGERKASFALFIEAMGGLDRKPRDSLLRLDDDFVYTRGRYGMDVIHKVKGVCERFGMAEAVNNREDWVRV